MNSPRNPLTALVITMTLSATIVTSQETLPFEFELPSSTVEVELNDCLLEVTIQPGAQPTVRAYELEGAVGEPATFTVKQGGGRVRIARTPPAEGTDPARAGVDLVLDPGQPLHVIGRNVVLVVNGPGVDAFASNQETPKLPGKGTDQELVMVHTYDLVDSDADLTGIPSATVVANNTAVRCAEGSGELAAQLSWAGLTVSDHHGGVRIASADSEISLERISGAVEFELEGGGLRLGEGSGSVQGSSMGGYLSSDRWNGQFSLEGSDASFEIRDASVGQLKINSSNTVSVLDEVRGNVTIEATGGQLTMDSIVGTLTVTVSDGGEVVSDVHHGSLALNLRDDSYGEINRSAGTAKVNVSFAELKVSGAKSLDLIAESSRVTLDGVQKLTGFEARQSEVELDMREASERRLTLDVGAGTSLELALKSPCKVQLRESAPGGTGVDVTGCELQLERAGRWRRGRLSIDDGRPPFMLIAKVAETGSLRVRGGS